MSNYNTRLQSQGTDLQTVLQTLQNKAAGGSTEQATPEISINSTGLITATAGTKSSTHQLAFQPAKTITPSTVSQIAVSSGYYTGGNITIKGDSNLVASNIKSGVSIFGISGTLEEGDIVETVVDDVSKAIIERTITEINDDRIGTIGNYAFANCSKLATISFPVATTIGSYAFRYCGSLTAASFPAATSIGSCAFYSCSRLTTASFPAATTIGSCAFMYCSKLATASFPAATSIGGSAFSDCAKLTTASFPAATTIGSCAFYGCYSLTTISFSAATTTIGSSAFQNCHSLTTVSFPAATSIGGSAFNNCRTLTTVSFPAATSIGGSAFCSCSKLATASFPAATSIGSCAFYRCSSLTSLYLTGSSIPTLSNVNAFYATPMSVSTYTGSFGSIFVPASLVASYKTATNWATYADRITAIE